MTDDQRNPFRTSDGESTKPEWALIGSRLASIRASRAQPEMAEALGVSKTTYGRLERGQREVGADVLSRLAQLGWSPLWVLTGIEPAQLAKGVPSEAATDTALVVARDDVEAARRRDQRIADLAAGYSSQIAPDKASQPARLDQDMLRAAAEVLERALDEANATTDAGGRAELFVAIYELLEQGSALEAAQRVVASMLRAASRAAGAPAKQG